jgi:uncharacterized protein
MTDSKLYNPFPVAAYHGAEYFCDRRKETLQLINQIRAGNSTTLIAIRRIGKTGLLQHVLSQLPEEHVGIYIDILETETLGQFLNKLSTSLLHAAPEKSKLGKNIWNFIKSIRPVISFDLLTGAPQATFDLKQKETEQNIDSILNFLDQQHFKTVIAIDEFQQIVNYPEKNTDAWLRSRIQLLKNIVFIFSGSQQHLMTELFASPKRPFFRSTSILKLEKLDFQVYRDFIVEMFHKYKKEMSPAIAEEILRWGNVHTYYIQQICNRVFTATAKQVTPELWKQQVYDLLKEQEIVFLGYRNLLTNVQWQLLKSIASEEKVYHPTGKEFMSKHKLTNSATIIRTLQSLLQNELIYKDFDKEGRAYYSVYDVFFQKWCSEK